VAGEWDHPSFGCVESLPKAVTRGIWSNLPKTSTIAGRDPGHL